MARVRIEIYIVQYQPIILGHDLDHKLLYRTATPFKYVVLVLNKKKNLLFPRNSKILFSLDF